MLFWEMMIEDLVVNEGNLLQRVNVIRNAGRDLRDAQFKYMGTGHNYVRSLPLTSPITSPQKWNS